MTYLNVTEVESALIALDSAFANTCHLIALPNQTHEGRTSHAVRLSLGPLDDRPAILFVGGQHAREWGSAEICINFAADVLEAYAGNAGLSYGGQNFPASTIKHLMETAQIFVLACANPDGRHHSQTEFAMWRKNRNPAGAVDLNRNYDVLWDFEAALHPSAGAVVSNDPATDVYHGTAPFSEPETQNVRWLIDQHPQIRWCIDIHSSGQLLYHNWGHDQNQIIEPNQHFMNAAFDGQRGVANDAYGEYIPPADLGTQCALVERMQTAIAAVRGFTYLTGQSYALYPTTGTLTDYPYSRHFGDPNATKIHGFLLEWGTEFQPPWAEMENIIRDVSAALVAFAEGALEDCGVLDITLETPTLQFTDVPEGETTYRAVTFKVTACCTVDFEIIDGPDVLAGPPGTLFGTPLGHTHAATAAPNTFSKANLWVSYTGTNQFDEAEGTVTVRCRQTGQVWPVPISTNVIPRPTAEIVLVFDRSNSMSFPSGIAPGISRSDVLKFSAPPFIDVIEDGNAVGIVQFDHDAYEPMAMTEADLAGRITANGHIADYAHNPSGWTSIGEGVALARDLINDAAVDKTVKAMVILTDGAENHDGFTRQYIDDVSNSIDNRVYAIGLGTPENLQPTALQALCAGQDGFMMMTGALDTNALFRLTKYYQQILAGVTNNQIVLDPEGAIGPGQEHTIPFKLAETDISTDVLLLSPFPSLIDFTLRMPDGTVIDPGVAASTPLIQTGGGAQVNFYRINLPVVLSGGFGHEGTWQAILEVDPKVYREHVAKQREKHDRVLFSLNHGVPYCVMSRAHSNLRLQATLTQSGNEPGAELMLRATLNEYGVPVEDRAHVVAELETPDGAQSVLALAEVQPGVFALNMTATLTGVYRWRLLAAGKTFRGTPFTREQLLTGAVWAGGNQRPPKRKDTELCDFLESLLANNKTLKTLDKLGFDARQIRKSLSRCKRGSGAPR